MKTQWTQAKDYISIYIFRNILEQLVSGAVIFCLIVFPVDSMQTHLDSIWHNNQMKLMIAPKILLSEVFIWMHSQTIYDSRLTKGRQIPRHSALYWRQYRRKVFNSSCLAITVCTCSWQTQRKTLMTDMHVLISECMLNHSDTVSISVENWENDEVLQS